MARFEWRRFEKLGLPDDGGLTRIVSSIEPAKRHFFVHVGRDRTTCEPVLKRKLGTLNEARALAEVIEREGWQRVLVLSSGAHLPRCLLALRTFTPAACDLVAVATREPGSGAFRERFKYAGYLMVSGLLRLTGAPRKL